MKDIKYNILFVPKIKDRLKLGLIRRSISKKVFSTQALQYPVHMSVISGGFYVTDYNKFEESLRGLLKKEKPIEIFSEGLNSFVLPEKFWTGIHINRNVEITNLQHKLQNIRNLYTEEKKDLKEGQLHITFAFPAKVDELKPIKLPVTKFLIDRITIVKKEGELAPYRIHKHIKLDI
jgi:2'-5' RNA ligase